MGGAIPCTVASEGGSSNFSIEEDPPPCAAHVEFRGVRLDPLKVEPLGGDKPDSDEQESGSGWQSPGELERGREDKDEGAELSSSAMPAVGTKEHRDPLRLLDVSLIVVGKGAVAASLVRRRRLEGGRVCWLKTRRHPEAFVGPTQQTELAEPSSCCRVFSNSRQRSQLDAQIEWSLSNFRWSLPSQRRERRQRRSTVLARDTQHWRSSGYTWGTSGTEMVDLGEDETYSVILGLDGRVPGIVMQGREKTESWEMSGTVVFAGADFGSLKGSMDLCETEEAAAELDVGVCNEEAKPFSITRPLHCLAWSGFFFIQFLAFFLLMGIFEPHLRPGGALWWRASFFSMSMYPFGLVATPDLLGPALTGRHVDRRLAHVMALACSVCLEAPCVIPLGWVGDRFYTIPVFFATCIGFSGYVLVSIPLHCLFAKRHRAPAAGQEERRMRVRAHVGWVLWILTGTFGTWVLLYGVALSYTHLILHYRMLAILALPWATSAVELFAVRGTYLVYTNLVLGTRLKDWGFTFLGDQREAAIYPICITHSYAESTKLVSVLVTATKQPGFDWLITLLSGFVLNLLQRSTILTKLLARLLPSRWWWLIAPNAGNVLHNDVRLCFGYPRFVPILALAVTNVLLHGFGRWPLYNAHATMLVPVAALLEWLEDAIVISGVLQSNSWKVTLAPVYRSFAPLHPGLVVGYDTDGKQPIGPSLSFSCTRHLKFRSVIIVMAPACFFAYNILVILLGAGFVHGVCDSWIAERYRLIDGLAWWTPLRCSELN